MRQAPNLPLVLRVNLRGILLILWPRRRLQAA